MAVNSCKLAAGYHPTELVSDNISIKEDRDIRDLLEWIKNRPCPTELNEQFVKFCYNIYKRNFNRTKTFLEQQITAENEVIGSYLDWNEMERALISIVNTVAITTVLDGDTEQLIVIYTLLDNDPEKFISRDIKLRHIIMKELIGSFIRLDEKGVVVILNYKGITMRHILKVGFENINKEINAIRYSMSKFVRQVHIVNGNREFSMLYSMFVGLLSEKMKQKVVLHTDIHSLYNYIPRNILPEEYGGDAPSVLLLNEIAAGKMFEVKEQFLRTRKYPLDEYTKSLRPEINSSGFGVGGNFRQLDFD